MKDITQLLAEKADALRITNKRVAKLVEEVLAENCGKNLEGKLARLTAIETEHNKIVAPIKKNNGASDNANQESFSESSQNEGADDTVSRKALVDAAMKAFGFTEAEAEFFASDKPVNAEVDALTKAVLGGK